VGRIVHFRIGLPLDISVPVSPSPAWVGDALDGERPELAPEVQSLAPRAVEQTVSSVQLFQELGTIVGHLLFVFLVVRIAAQRRLMRVFLVPGLIVLSCVYFFCRDT
jgi:hypothetical protein